MSYSVDELFRFEKTESGYIITDFIQRESHRGYGFLDDLNNDERVTELNIPAEYKGEPVVEIGKSAFDRARYLEKVTIPEGVRRIGENAFHACEKLRSVSLPASLEEIDKEAFHTCEELREVEFKSSPSFDPSAFAGDFKLPAELVLVGVLRSHDLTRPFSYEELMIEISLAEIFSKELWFLLRPDVFALALKNGCFRKIGTELRLQLFECFIENSCTEQLEIVIDYNELNAALLGELIERSVQRKKPEITAYLLELKKRKFGFNGGDDFEL